MSSFFPFPAQKASCNGEQQNGCKTFSGNEKMGSTSSTVISGLRAGDRSPVLPRTRRAKAMALARC